MWMCGCFLYMKIYECVQWLWWKTLTIIDNDDVNFISDSVRTNFNNQQRIPFSSSTRMTISNRYDAWINITNFTIDHQGIYRMIFYRRKNLLLLPENIDSKNNGNSSNDNGDNDDDDDEHEIIYEHSFKLIAFSMYQLVLFFSLSLFFSKLNWIESINQSLNWNQ